MLKLTVNKSELFKVLSTVAQAAASKSTINILQGILLNVENNVLTLTGYDLEIGIRCSIPVKDTTDGELVVNSTRLCSAVSKMEDGDILIEEKGNNYLFISNSRTTIKIPGIESKEYPKLPQITRGESFEISEGLLKGMIKQTSYAVSSIDIKPSFTGTYFHIKDNKLNLVSTDKFRIAARREELVHEDFEFIVPGKTLGKLVKVLSDDEEKKVTIAVDRNQSIFKIGDYSIFSKLIEGEFSDYEKIRDENDEFYSAVLSTEDFIAGVDKTFIFLSDNCKASVDLTFENNSLNIYCSTANGEVDQTIPAEYDNEKLEISFNGRFLMEALRNINADKIRVGVSSRMRSFLIRPVDNENTWALIAPNNRSKRI